LVLVAAAGWFTYTRQKAYRKDAFSTAPSVPSPQITEPTETKEKSYTLIGYSQTSAATEIFSVNLTDKKRRIIFTDRDENLKVRQLRRAVAATDEVLAYLAKKGEQEPKVLGMIKLTDPVKITTLLDGFGSSDVPIPSPDGKKIAYVVFSNADPDYGYSLLIMNRDGSNKRRLIKREKLIRGPAFSPDGQEIAFLADTGSGTVIEKINSNGTGEVERLAEFTNEIVYDLYWGDALYFGKRGKEESLANGGEIYRLSEKGTGLSRVTTNDSFDGYPVVSPDGKKLSLIRTKFPQDKYTAAAEFTLVVINMDNRSEIELGSSDGILSWQVSENFRGSP
jgi:Tol biopolymer transport system component